MKTRNSLCPEVLRHPSYKVQNEAQSHCMRPEEGDDGPGETESFPITHQFMAAFEFRDWPAIGVICPCSSQFKNKLIMNIN